MIGEIKRSACIALAVAAMLLLAECYPGTQASFVHYNAEFSELTQVRQCLLRAGRCDERGDAAGKERAFRRALSIVWQPDRHAARMAVLDYYLSLPSTVQNSYFMNAALAMKKEAILCREEACLARAHQYVASGYLSEGDIESALRESDQSLLYASQSGDDALLARIEIQHARVLARGTQKDARVEAIQFLLHARFRAAKAEDTAALEHAYGELSNFYADIGGFDSSAAYKMRELEIFLRRNASDSDGIQALRMELAEPLLKAVSTPEGERILHQVITYALRRGNDALLNDAMRYYRNFLLERNDLGGVSRIYLERYPSALAHVQDENTRLRIKAYLFHYADQQDSALAYYDKALEGLRHSGSIYQYTYLQVFHGRALRRWGKPHAAIRALQLGFAETPSHLPFTMLLMSELDSTFLALRQYDSAYIYHRRFEQARLTWDSSVNGEALLRLQLADQLRTHAFAEERSRQLRQQRHFAQYMLIVLAIGVIFLAFSLLSSFRVPKWTITATGFFACVVLFEFIIMLADETASHKVHDEPLYLLLCKIGFILLLSPLHHKLEEAMLHYFYKHRLISPSGIREFAKSFRQRIREKLNERPEA
jgi:hypothetical protein